MNLETVSKKHVNELERCVRELLYTMRKAKLNDEVLTESLRQLEKTLGEARRERFDAVNPEYRGF